MPTRWGTACSVKLQKVQRMGGYSHFFAVLLLLLPELADGDTTPAPPDGLPAGDAAVVDSAPTDGDAVLAGRDWPLFRGDRSSTGVARCNLPQDLKLLWTYEVDKGCFETAPAIVDGMVYLGDMDGKVHALELASGRKTWERATESGFLASPSVEGGRVFIGDFDGRFHCLNAADGSPLWTFTSEAEIDSSANFFDDKVIFGSQDAVLYCLEAANGKLVWKHEIADQIRCTPTIVERRCFVAGCDARLHVVSLDDGREVAAVEIQAPTGVTPAALGDRVYFGTEGGSLFCVDWKEAKVVWTFEGQTRGQSFRGSPAVTDKVVVAGARDKRVYALDPATGRERWQFSARSRIDGSPVIAGDRVLVPAADGRLYALGLDTGEELWQFEAKGGFTGSPAVAAGRLVVASDAGVVYCFGEEARKP